MAKKSPYKGSKPKVEALVNKMIKDNPCITPYKERYMQQPIKCLQQLWGGSAGGIGCTSSNFWQNTF